MRHRISKSQLNRFTSWRKATLISLARSVLVHQSIKTTKTRAKATRSLVEKLISLAKTNSLAAKRQAYKVLNDHKIVSLLFNEIGPRFKNRTSGFVRVMLLGNRRGDNAQLAVLELTELKKKETKKPKKEKEPKPKEEDRVGVTKEEPVEEKVEEKKVKTETQVSEKPPITKKPPKKFLGGIRNIFKKKSDSL